MRYEEIGRSGIRASVVGFGTWVTGGWLWGGANEQESVQAIHCAIDQGISLIDTAPVYGFGRSEEIVGKAIAGKRDKVVLATKCGQIWHTSKGRHAFDSDGKSIYHYLGPESVRYALAQSLRRLHTEYVDIYFIHVPDPTTPAVQTVEELSRLKKQGKIRVIGVSNMSLDQLADYAASGIVEVDQEKYSMLDRQIEICQVPFCEQHSISLMAYSPLVQGLLTGKIGPDRKFFGDDMRRENSRFQPENLRKVTALLDRIRPIAAKYKVTLAELAIAWTVASPPVRHVLVGARTADQVRENARAGDLKLTEEELDIISSAIEEHAADIP